MRKILTIFTTVFLSAALWAQSPEKISYQAVIRDAGDHLIMNTQIGMQISILQGSSSGTEVYAETQTPTTNANGLVSIEIGEGTVVTGDFASIDWTNGPYFLKTETAVEAPLTNYTVTGTTQLLSVPYALHSKTAEAITGEIQETDPAVAANFDFTDAATGDLLQFDGTKWVKLTPGYISDYTVTETDVTAHEAALTLTESQISDLGNYIETETDPSVPVGTQTGEMQYWDGSEWITVVPGNEGQVLTMNGGIPTWQTQLEEGDVRNPITGEIWMDRNLGASRVATGSADADAYGDLYQWGRAADGHEKRTSGTTTTLSNSDDPGHGDFIINGSNPFDWRSPQNNNLWQGVSGTNNPCPEGYRVPTKAEWDAEIATWDSEDAAGAFSSPLRLPLAGSRVYNDGSLRDAGSFGRYWSSTLSATSSHYLNLFSTFAFVGSFSRAEGFSVRCIKN